MNTNIGKIMGTLSLRNKNKSKGPRLELAESLLKALAPYSELSDLAQANFCTTQQIKEFPYVDAYYNYSQSKLKELIKVNAEIGSQ